MTPIAGGDLGSYEEEMKPRAAHGEQGAAIVLRSSSLGRIQGPVLPPDPVGAASSRDKSRELRLLLINKFETTSAVQFGPIPSSNQ